MRRGLDNIDACAHDAVLAGNTLLQHLLLVACWAWKFKIPFAMEHPGVMYSGHSALLVPSLWTLRHCKTLRLLLQVGVLDMRPDGMGAMSMHPTCVMSVRMSCLPEVFRAHAIPAEALHFLIVHVAHPGRYRASCRRPLRQGSLMAGAEPQVVPVQTIFRAVRYLYL